jgi:hypothetical protein
MLSLPSKFQPFFIEKNASLSYLESNNPTITEDNLYNFLFELRNKGHAKEALKILENFKSQLEETNKLRFEIENTYTLALAGHPIEALEILQVLKAHYPTNIHIWRVNCEILILLNRLPEALEILKKTPLTSESPDTIMHYLFKAIEIENYILNLQNNKKFCSPIISLPEDRAMLVMMIRDEEDIIAQNLKHHYALGFRKFILILNKCIDNTSYKVQQFKLQYNDAVVLTIEDPIEAYYQAGKTAAAVNFGRNYFEAIQRQVEWCFILDADEFINFEKIAICLN